MTGSHSCAKARRDSQNGRIASPFNTQRMQAMSCGAMAIYASAHHASHVAMRCAHFAGSGALLGFIARRSSLPHAMSPHTTSAGPQVPSYGMRAVARATIRHQNDPNVHGTHLEGHFGDSPHAAKMTGSHSCAKGRRDSQKGRIASPFNMQRVQAMSYGAMAIYAPTHHASHVAMR